jgi:hypothetical protein
MGAFHKQLSVTLLTLTGRAKSKRLQKIRAKWWRNLSASLHKSTNYALYKVVRNFNPGQLDCHGD